VFRESLTKLIRFKRSKNCSYLSRSEW